MEVKTRVIYLLEQMPLWEVLLMLTGAFLFLYFSITSMVHFGARRLLKLGRAEKIKEGPYFKGQIGFEIRHSLFSVLVFGLYGVLIVWSYRQGTVQVDFAAHFWKIALDLLVLIIWNEVHFYGIHRLMHTKPLVKYHGVHHRSMVVTSFSTYSFHPIESILLGSVMILPMFAYAFNYWALILLPVYSLVFNSLGHSNMRLKIKWMKHGKMSERHNRHHTGFHFNFGFASGWLDKILQSDKKRKN